MEGMPFNRSRSLIPVRFPTSSPFTVARMADSSQRPPRVEGRGLLFEPGSGQGLRPAVVVMEGLGGLKPSREIGYGHKLARAGFVTLVVDTFGARGAGRLPDNLRALAVTEAMFLADAYGALRFLRGHPQVNPDAVSVMGFSYGGMVSVLAAYEQMARLFSPAGDRFAAHVSFYGSSVPRLEQPVTTGAPVLIMLGELDRNVCIPRTEAIAGDLRRGGSEVRLRVFPGAYHQWNGNDAALRKVTFGIGTCKVRVDGCGAMIDERTGLTVRGPLSRTLSILLGADWRGYHIQRDDETTRRSDTVMVDFLYQASKAAAPKLRCPPRSLRASL